MVFIYILKLEHEKYYIGKTNNPQFRLENHFNLNGSEWTKIHKPISILELRSNCDDYDEDKITKQYMDKYGIDSVRGGSFVSVKLEQSVIDVLLKMNKGTNDKCFVCGKEGHFAKDCIYKKNKTELKCESNINNNLVINKKNNLVSDTNKIENIQQAQYNICINGPKCKGCNNSDRCKSNHTEVLYYNNNDKIMYDKNNEIYEKCSGKYNWIYHNTSRYLI